MKKIKNIKQLRKEKRQLWLREKRINVANQFRVATAERKLSSTEYSTKANKQM